jgi:hypothetical protein
MLAQSWKHARVVRLSAHIFKSNRMNVFHYPIGYLVALDLSSSFMAATAVRTSSAQV